MLQIAWCLNGARLQSLGIEVEMGLGWGWDGVGVGVGAYPVSLPTSCQLSINK